MQSKDRRGNRAALAAISILLLPLVLVAGKDTKLTAEELVAKHLDALGTLAARAAAKSRVAQGTGRLQVVLGGHADMSGPAAFATEGRKEMYMVNFGVQQYPREALAFDGEKLVIPRVTAETRSRLGEFLNRHDVIIREGLLGGALSTAWPLLDLEGRQPALKSAGLKKVEGKELYRLDYHPRRGDPELKISLYFEPETFHHVLTIYEMSIGAEMGGPPGHGVTTAVQYGTHFKLEELFSDFLSVDGLTLPSRWNIRLTTEKGTDTSIWQWETSFATLSHNREIDPKVFLLEQ